MYLCVRARARVCVCVCACVHVSMHNEWSASSTSAVDVSHVTALFAGKVASFNISDTVNLGGVCATSSLLQDPANVLRQAVITSQWYVSQI